MIFDGRSVISNYVPISAVLQWYSKREGHDYCNGRYVILECGVYTQRIPLHIVGIDVAVSMPLLFTAQVAVSAGAILP